MVVDVTVVVYVPTEEHVGTTGEACGILLALD